MARNCKEIVQEMCANLGLVQPNTAVSSADIQIIQMLSILNEEGSKLARRHPWEALTREASFTTLAAAEQGALHVLIGAANNYRKILNETIFNRTTRQIILGPLSSFERQARQAFPSAGPYSQYFLRSLKVYFDPVPAAGDSCFFEYVSNNWVTDVALTGQRARLTMDDDVALFDDELLLAGLKWRWNKSKGLDYQEDFVDYERMVAEAITSDATARRIRLDNEGWGSVRGIGVPSGSWNL